MATYTFPPTFRSPVTVIQEVDILPNYRLKQTLPFFPPLLNYGIPSPSVINSPNLNQFCNNINTCAL